MSKSWTHAAHPIAMKLRAAAMAYPRTEEDFPWGHPAYKAAGKKAFLFLGGYGGALSVSMKLPFRHEEACAAGAAPTGYGLGRSGWVTFTFAAKARRAPPLMLDYLDESWRAVAPKTLTRSLAEAPPATSKKAAPRRKAAK